MRIPRPVKILLGIILCLAPWSQAIAQHQVKFYSDIGVAGAVRVGNMASSSKVMSPPLTLQFDLYMNWSGDDWLEPGLGLYMSYWPEVSFILHPHVKIRQNAGSLEYFGIVGGALYAAPEFFAGVTLGGGVTWFFHEIVGLTGKTWVGVFPTGNRRAQAAGGNQVLLEFHFVLALRVLF